MKQSKFEMKNVLLLAMPLIFSNLINAASGLISMYFLSQIDASALAAGAIITSTYGFIIMMVVAMLYSVSIMVGKMHGAGQHHDVGSIVFAGIIITVAIGTPLTLIMQHMNPIFVLLGQPKTVSVLASDYFRGLALGLVPSLIGAVYMQLFMGTSSSRQIMYLTAFGVIVNSALTYACIFGYGSIPAMGVFGAGLANSITAYLMLIATTLYTVTSKRFSGYKLFHSQSFHLRYAAILLKIGTPISIQYTTELLAFSALTYLMGIIGTAALGAQQITLQCSMIGIMTVMAISQAGSILISQSIGRNEQKRIVGIANAAIALGTSVMLLLGIIYCFFPLKLIALYLNINNPSLLETINLTRIILFIATFTQLFDSGRNIAAGLLRGLGDTKTSMWTGIVSCWMIGLPAAVFLGFILHLGAPGVRLGMMLGIMVGCANLLYRFYSKMDTHLENSSIPMRA